MKNQRIKYRFEKDMDSYKERVSMKEEKTTPEKLLSHKGAIEKKSQQSKTHRKQLRTTENRRKKESGLLFVGFGDNLRGRRESVLKSDSPNLSTQPVFTVLRFPLHSYKALKASNHLLYSDSISNETLGFRSSSICLKSPIVIDRG